MFSLFIFRLNPGALQSMKSKVWLQIQKEKWSTPFLGNGMNLCFKETHRLLRASGERVSDDSVYISFDMCLLSEKLTMLLFYIVLLTDPMLKDQDQYYGFTQFALELNELDSALKPLLPPTDTRFRPDQRFTLFICFHYRVRIPSYRN